VRPGVPQVTFYSTGACPYCSRARRLLDSKGVAYAERRVDTDPELRREMETRTGGATSVPQIFIDEHHVGGFDELSELDIDGELDALLGLSESERHD
jgi:glutaredoxin 3